MNLHIPQTEEARAEAEILMEVQTQLISPRYGLSIIGCIQDSIAGNYYLTKDGGAEMTREEAIDLLLAVKVTDFKKLPNKKIVNGKDIFSCLLPNDFEFIGKSKNKQPVIIKKGVLMEGQMDKASLGGGSGLMLRNLHKKYGPSKTIDILGKMFRLGIHVLLKYGFTVAISDVELPVEADQKIKEILNNAKNDVYALIDEFKTGKLEAFPGRSAEETLELKILEKLNRARNETGTVVEQNVDRRRSTIIMTESGSRGGPLNLAQMSACVGQQAMRGARITKGYQDRTLSCFNRGDLGPSAHGFIRHGFKEGLTPSEFFFGAMTGRDSLMDTALRTPKSGYLYRRLANALQDLRVEYDETVRDATGKIVQFKYGEDSIDVSKSEGGTLNVQKIVESA
jgi:DNA-directed RNA polymerase subunit A'